MLPADCESMKLRKRENAFRKTCLRGLNHCCETQRQGTFPLARKILRAFYVRKNHTREQFPLLRKIMLLYVYVRFRPTNALGPGLKTKRAGI